MRVDQMPAGSAIITIQIAWARDTYLQIRGKNRSALVMQHCLNWWFLPQRLKNK